MEKNQKTSKKIASVALAALMAFSASTTVFAAIPKDGQTNAEVFASQNNLTEKWENWKTEWENTKGDWTKISMTIGADQSKRNFAWYSLNQNATLKVSNSKDMSNPISDQEITGKADIILKKGDTQYYACKAEVSDLSAGDYYYQIDDRDPVKFTVKDTSNGFSFIYVGDPQMGSSNSMKGSKIKTEEDAKKYYQAQSDAIRSDSFNWNVTLNSALKMSNNASFILSAGDQIQSRTKDAPANATDTSYSEIEYTGFLSAYALKSVPFAPTVGNHDSTLGNYNYHFNVPNESNLGSNGIVGGDYYFKFGNALFLVLNTQGTKNDEHKQFIEETCAENSDAKWKFVTLHQDIYGSGEHSNEPEITNLRYELAPVFEENDIDVVFTGHDHTYSRTFVLNGSRKTNSYYDNNEDEYSDMFDYDINGGETDDPVYTALSMIKNNTADKKQQEYLKYLNAVGDEQAIETTNKEKVVNPNGILYMTANSSSGSKYYDLTARKQSYVADRWQEDVPTYSVVDVTDNTFTINTYRTDTNEKIDNEFTIVKQDENTSKHVHEYSSEITKQPTCTESGIKTYKCECGERFNVTLSALGHNYKSVSVKSTYFEKGYTAKECSNCKAITNKKYSSLLTMAAPKATSTSSYVKLSWNKVKDAKGYDIYQNGKKIKTVTSTSYTVSKLKSGTTYKFTVKPYTKSGSKTVYGNSSKTLVTSTNPATVSFKLTGGSKKATVKWSKVTGASGYKIYCKTSENGSWKSLKAVNNKTTSFTKTGLIKGKTYYFTVKAYKTLNGKVYYGGITAKNVKVK